MKKAGSFRSLAGSFHRVCRGNVPLERMAVRASIEGQLNHAIAFAPPSTKYTWDRLNSAVSYAARVQQIDWAKRKDGEGADFAFVRGSSQVLENAGY